MPSVLTADFSARLDELLRGLAAENPPDDLREDAARALAEAVVWTAPTPAWREALHQLAVDEYAPIRRTIALALPDLPDDDFNLLAARMADDCNQYVCDAVAGAIERRGRGIRRGRKIQKNAMDVQSRFRAFEATFGPKAARQARRIANQMFEALVGGTLHDMVGILAPMRGDLDLIWKHMENGQPSRATCRIKVKRFRQQVEYLRAFLEDMRTYARAEDDRHNRVCVADLVERSLILARDGVRAAGLEVATVKVEADVPETLRAFLYPRQATTALMHLLRNGLEALLERPAAGEKRLAVRARSDDADGVVIVVEDNGPGIEPDTLRELLAFAPGKTTRKNRGTGFGIPTANRFAEAHGGKLEIKSQVGEGTVFTLYLPAQREDDVE